MEGNGANVMACDDMVVEVLCRLPGKDLIRCKCVCRAWHRLISEVCICRFTLNPPLSCLSVRVRTMHGACGTPPFRWFKHVDVGEEGSGGLARFVVNSWANLPYLRSSGCFLNSCNGLILCCSPVRPWYYVYNPTTGEFVLFPWASVHTERCSAALAFDPRESPHFKVVRFSPSGITHVAMDVYSSESGRWAGHVLTLDHLAPLSSWRPGMAFFDGTIYRLSATRHLLCFDLDTVNARRIDLPKSPREHCSLVFTGVLGASSGHLCFARLHIDELNLWSLDDDRREGGKWILKYRVTYDFAKHVPPSLRLIPRNCILACYGIHPGSDIVFIGAERMILSYDFKSNTVKEVVRTREETLFISPVCAHVQCLTSFAKAGMRIHSFSESDIVKHFLQNRGTESQSTIGVYLHRYITEVYNGIHALNCLEDKPFEDRGLI